jgi:thiamine biosynthesis lipoprotein
MIEPGTIYADPARTDSVVRLSHEAMACTFGVWIAGGDRRQAREAAGAAFDEADRIEQELSRFVEPSDVSRLNRSRAGETVRVGIEAYDCLKLALRVQHETDGAFDVTCAADAATGSGPSVRPAPALRLDENEHAVTILRDGVRIDLGGIGKGYALDRMAEILTEWGVARGLIHAGQSTVLAMTAPDDELDWPVSLRHPTRFDAVLGTVHLGRRRSRSGQPDRPALSGSGRLIHGAHILDPRTGRPAARAIAAWASAASAAEADALSTAFMVMTSAEVEPYCGRRPDIAALLALPPAEAPHLVDFGMGLPPRP